MEAKARQLELEEAKAKREEEAAKRAARNLKMWKRLGQELARIGMSLGDAVDLWLDTPSTEDVNALSSLLAGVMPEALCGFQVDLTDELCDSYMLEDLAEAGVSLDYVLTGERSEVSPRPAPEWLPLKWMPGTERPPRMLDAACVLGLSEKTAIKDVATWDGEKWIDGMGEPWDLPCLRWFPIPEDDDEEQEEV